MSWIRDKLLGLRAVFFGGEQLPERGALEFAGDGVEVEDDPSNKRTKVTISGGGGSRRQVIRWEYEGDTDALDEPIVMLSPLWVGDVVIVRAGILSYDDTDWSGSVNIARLQLGRYEPIGNYEVIAEISTGVPGGTGGWYGLFSEVGATTIGFFDDVLVEEPVPLGWTLYFRAIKEGAGVVLPRFVLWVEWEPAEEE